MSSLDLGRFLAICGPAGEDVAEIVAFFVEYMTGQLDALRAAVHDGRVEDVELIAHRCAGSSGTYGLDPLVEPFAAIERRARNGDLTAAPALEREARAVFATIETELRNLPTPRSQP